MKSTRVSRRPSGIESHKARVGESHGNAKLSDAKVTHLRRWIREDTYTISQIAERYKVASVTVYYAAIGDSWKHVPEPVVDYQALGRGRFRAPTGSKEHKGQTLLYLSSHTFRYLRRHRRYEREGLSHVLDRLIGKRTPPRPYSSETTARLGARRRTDPPHATWISLQARMWLRAAALSPREGVWRVLDRLIASGVFVESR